MAEDHRDLSRDLDGFDTEPSHDEGIESDPVSKKAVPKQASRDLVPTPNDPSRRRRQPGVKPIPVPSWSETCRLTVLKVPEDQSADLLKHFATVLGTAIVAIVLGAIVFAAVAYDLFGGWTLAVTGGGGSAVAGAFSVWLAWKRQPPDPPPPPEPPG